MPNISAPEIILLLLVALLLFGAKRLPEIGRSLGTGMREFKDSVTGNTKPERQMQSHIPPRSIACYCAPSARARSSTSRATARPSAKPPSTSVRV